VWGGGVVGNVVAHMLLLFLMVSTYCPSYISFCRGPIAVVVGVATLNAYTDANDACSDADALSDAFHDVAYAAAHYASNAKQKC